jgi:hypothetical protein
MRAHASLLDCTEPFTPHTRAREQRVKSMRSPALLLPGDDLRGGADALAKGFVKRDG